MDLTIQLLTTDRPAQLDALVAHLASSGRVFRLPDTGAWVLVDPEAGSQILPVNNPADFGGQLINSGLVRLLNGAVPASPAIEGPYTKLMGACASNPSYADRLPLLRGAAYLPALQFDDTGRRLIQAKPGFDMTKGRNVLFVRRPGPMWPEVDPSYPHLRTMFSGLRFSDPVYYANLLAVSLAMFARTAMTEFPVILIDADEASVGKTRTATALGRLLKGEPVSPMPYPGGEAEMKVQIGTVAGGRPGPNFVFIDNVAVVYGNGRRIDSPTLSVLATSKCSNLRVLYKGGSPVFDPVIVFTMNGARVGNDLALRIVRISLMKPPGTAHHLVSPDPVTYVAEHQIMLRAEAFHLLQRLELRPVTEGVFHTRFYDFERVAVAAGEALGLKPSFDPAVVQNADSVVHELYYLLDDSVDGRLSLLALVQRVMSSSRYPDLRALLEAQPRENNGLVQFLQGWLETTLLKRHYRIKKIAFRFVSEHDQALASNFLRIQRLTSDVDVVNS